MGHWRFVTQSVPENETENETENEPVADGGLIQQSERVPRGESCRASESTAFTTVRPDRDARQAKWRYDTRADAITVHHTKAPVDKEGTGRLTGRASGTASRDGLAGPTGEQRHDTERRVTYHRWAAPRAVRSPQSRAKTRLESASGSPVPVTERYFGERITKRSENR